MIGLLIFLALCAVLAFLWWLGSRSEPIPPKAPGQTWRYTDPSPEHEPPYARAADYIEHTLDFATLRYQVVRTWHNDDIAAESDISIATEEFEVRRDDDGWQMHLLKRNHSDHLSPQPWQPAPREYSKMWDAGWRRWSAGQRSALIDES